MQGTTYCHHEIAAALLPQADPVFDDATAPEQGLCSLEPWMLQQNGAAQDAPGVGGAGGTRTRSRGAGAKMPFEFPIRPL